ESESAAGGGGLDFGQALLHRKWMLLFLIALGVGAGSLVHSRTEPVYASFAKLYIRQNQPTLVDGAGRTGQKNPLETYSVLICSPRIIQKAIADGSLRDLPSLKGASAAATIIGGLTAAPHEDSTDYLMLSYSGKNQADTQKILDAVINAFVQDLEDSRSTMAAGDIKIITDARNKLQAELTDLEAKYAEFRKTAGLLYTQDGGLNFHQQRLTDIESKRSALMIEKSQTQTQLTAIEKALQGGAKREALLLMVDQLDQNSGATAVGAEPPPTSFLSHLLPLLTEKQLLVEKVGARHPDVLALESRINLTRELLQEQSGVTVSGEPLDLLAVYVESLQEKLATLESNLGGMNELFIEESKASADISELENEDRAGREKIELTKSMFAGYVEMLQRVNVAGEVGHVSADPTDPPTVGRQVAPVLVRSLALGGVGGLLVGILLAFLLEMADQSYRSPDDITRQLGVPVVGHIPNIEVGRERKRIGASRLHPSLVTYHRPGSQMAEAYRAVRTALLSGTRNQPHQLIQITSPNPGDGKSTLSTNLAMSIAKAGKSVLLIDADLRRPNVHKLLGMDCDIGVTSVVEGGADFDDAIQSGPVPHLDVMTAGPQEKNRAELLLSPRFAEMLNALRERYDYVIVDTPPLLAVSDPAAIGAMVDGVILVLRINRQARLHAVRARETLDLVGARLIGVVVNALGDSSAVQGFGTGTRGYRAATYRTLAQGYTDSYGGEGQYRGYDSYYQESEEPEPLNGHHDLAGSRSDYDR
ncbi:MAG: polysaccharide biosynthesis tyrosine autokinase, partial [Planctomycetaceae bacterium]|nr:polysaccharide biosynthesis tyrosine autokinase [Planctomycetaceae bacterium]